MKTTALTILAVLIMSTASFATDSTDAVESQQMTFLQMPESLQRALIWSRILGMAPEGGYSVFDMARHVQSVDAAIEALKAYKK